MPKVSTSRDHPFNPLHQPIVPQNPTKPKKTTIYMGESMHNYFPFQGSTSPRPIHLSQHRKKTEGNMRKIIGRKICQHFPRRATTSYRPMTKLILIKNGKNRGQPTPKFGPDHPPPPILLTPILTSCNQKQRQEHSKIHFPSRPPTSKGTTTISMIPRPNLVQKPLPMEGKRGK